MCRGLSNWCVKVYQLIKQNNKRKVKKMITYDLTGKTALVTGSNRGIGKAMADALEAAGAKVVRTSSAECDLTDRAAVYAFIEKIKKEHQIDILVNNAGTILRKPAAEHPDEYWDKVMDVNINSQPDIIYLSCTK